MKAIKWVKDNCYHTTLCDKERRVLGSPCICGLSQALAELEELEKACRWIPVSEGMPKNIADVWILLDRHVAGKGFYGELENGWGWEIYTDTLLTNVTHWKPIILPEAALGEEGKDG